LLYQLQQVGLHFTEREFFHLATAVDTDGSGEISFKEFCQMFIKGKEGGAESISWPKSVSGGSRDHESVGNFNFSHLTRYGDLAPGGWMALSGGITLTLWITLV